MLDHFSGEWTKLMATGNAEIIDLSGQNQSCPSIAPAPNGGDLVSIFINGKALICGGINILEFEFTYECYSYNMAVSYLNYGYNEL